jgi:predicted secreted protein
MILFACARPVAEAGFAVTVGERFEITVEGTPGTGYLWRLARPLDAAVVTLVGTEHVQRAPGRPGGTTDEVWTFQAVGRGNATIDLEYVRPWETGARPARILRRSVTVR